MENILLVGPILSSEELIGAQEKLESMGVKVHNLQTIYLKEQGDYTNQWKDVLGAILECDCTVKMDGWWKDDLCFKVDQICATTYTQTIQYQAFLMHWEYALESREQKSFKHKVKRFWKNIKGFPLWSTNPNKMEPSEAD